MIKTKAVLEIRLGELDSLRRVLPQFLTYTGDSFFIQPHDFGIVNRLSLRRSLIFFINLIVLYLIGLG